MATISDVRLDRPIVIYPCITEGIHSTPIAGEEFILNSYQGAGFIESLKSIDALCLIEETLQGLAQRDDGTLLKTAFPSFEDVSAIIHNINSLPSDFFVIVEKWKTLGSTEICFDFEEK